MDGRIFAPEVLCDGGEFVECELDAAGDAEGEEGIVFAAFEEDGVGVVPEGEVVFGDGVGFGLDDPAGVVELGAGVGVEPIVAVDDDGGNEAEECGGGEGAGEVVVELVGV